MRIIKRGKIPVYTKQFTCDNCGTVFEAENDEYKSCGQMAYMDGLLYMCQCPVCGKMAYIEAGGKE